MKAHYLLVFIFIVALIPMVSAQQIIRQTICSVGMNTNSGNFVLKQTIGQPSNTSTFKTESGMLRQGFSNLLILTEQLYITKTQSRCNCIRILLKIVSPC